MTPTATDASTKTSLTGIKPTDTPHLGNYLGAIRPALKLSEQFKSYYFIADYHAITTLRDPVALQQNVYDVAATWLACGLDPDRTVFFRQSDVLEVFELAWILSCLVATGQLERGHAYKDALAKGDAAPNAGIFYYPVLMAADILLYDTDVVPVGKDQKQHIEVCRDLAVRFNHVYGEDVLVVPEAHISEDAPLVPGLDGEKMSKSRGNSIPLFASSKELRKVVMKITTGSESLEEPKVAEGTTVYELTKQLTPSIADEMKRKLEAGNYGWGHAKQDFFEALDAELGPKRDVYTAFRSDEEKLDRVLADGAERARTLARATMARVREAIGIARPIDDLRRTVSLKRSNIPM
ncbi:MAG: tryptophan--tRNA ligase [Sandaracinus sp.]|nr:tryptophan--tRNA ligase [Sandaracinus sp.]MCB9633845.1 tryptophan--tRNA ligase [Sandaracinus sp.]